MVTGVEDSRDGVPDGVDGMTRREWDLAEEVRELRAELESAARAEAMREIEIRSLRHELELRMAYNESLERLAEDRERHISWLTRYLDRGRTGELDLTEEDARALLWAERQRTSYKVVQWLTTRSVVNQLIRNMRARRG